MTDPTGQPAPTTAERLSFRPVTKANWRDFEALFEARGAPKYCWCMAWRGSAEEARHRAGRDRKRQIKARVDRGVPVGLLAYLDGMPVAWVSIAPRASYRDLGGAEANPGELIWSLVCFYVSRAHRGKRLSQRLIEAAVSYAGANGATTVEAYPVDTASPSYRFMGFVPVFAAAGFSETGRAGARRHVMRLDVKS
jgi:GNAT superfamily N-acetyltransferase